jgi:hypothetical protein
MITSATATPTLPGLPQSSAIDCRKSKPTRTQEELASMIMTRLKNFPECYAITGVVIAPVLKPDDTHPNWRAAFTLRGTHSAPRVAWRIGSQVAEEFDYSEYSAVVDGTSRNSVGAMDR